VADRHYKLIKQGLPGNVNFQLKDLDGGETIVWDPSINKWIAVPSDGVIGTGNHDDLYNRSAANQHPMEAITGLLASQAAQDAAIAALESGTGATSFLELTDTPDSYSGHDGEYVQVSGGALVFAAGTGGGGSDRFYDGGGAYAVPVFGFGMEGGGAYAVPSRYLDGGDAYS
jgi:hypothetical protein